MLEFRNSSKGIYSYCFYFSYKYYCRESYWDLDKSDISEFDLRFIIIIMVYNLMWILSLRVDFLYGGFVVDGVISIFYFVFFILC